MFTEDYMDSEEREEFVETAFNLASKVGSAFPPFALFSVLQHAAERRHLRSIRGSDAALLMGPCSCLQILTLSQC